MLRPNYPKQPFSPSSSSSFLSVILVPRRLLNEFCLCLDELIGEGCAAAPHALSSFFLDTVLDEAPHCFWVKWAGWAAGLLCFSPPFLWHTALRKSLVTFILRSRSIFLLADLTVSTNGVYTQWKAWQSSNVAPLSLCLGLCSITIQVLNWVLHRLCAIMLMIIQINLYWCGSLAAFWSSSGCFCTLSMTAGGKSGSGKDKMDLFLISLCLSGMLLTQWM